LTGGPYLLAIDQGTTSTRSLVIDASCRVLACAQKELPQYYPQPGWVEHDLEDIWQDTLSTARAAIARAGVPIAALGIANQRETVALWSRATGVPVHRAIVWQDRRTSSACEELRRDGAEDFVHERTGLLLDPYFSATKLAWILDNVPGARDQAERGELAFGTIDSFLLWRLTGGRVHASDATNASRTLLFDIHRQCFDDELLRLFKIPRPVLPEVFDNATLFGTTAPGVFEKPIPITGMAGDQQAALIGQACFAPDMVKATYGTGCFALVNTGAAPIFSSAQTLTTLAYRLGGVLAYAAEGAIFIAGAAIKWLRDGLGLVANVAETAELAASVSGTNGVYMVPAFVGLGAPHWDSYARGLICGLTLDTTRAHIARAALESIAYQTLDLMDALTLGQASRAALRIDGGMAANDWFCQFLADILARPVERPVMLETTAQGAAFLAGLGAGIYSDLETVSRSWTLGRRFEPRMSEEEREVLVEGWHAAVARALSGPSRILQ
jgi:glycerol kinase